MDFSGLAWVRASLTAWERAPCGRFNSQDEGRGWSTLRFWKEDQFSCCFSKAGRESLVAT